MSEFNYKNPVIFDIETNGRDQIIQIAAIAPLAEESFECKVAFDPVASDWDTLKKVHYDPKAWKFEAVEPEDARAMFSKFLKRHAGLQKITEKRNRYRVAAGMGYNAYSFDYPLLKSWFGDEFLPMDPRVFDVFHLAMWLLPFDLPSYSLGNVAALLKVDRPRKHDALVDCEITTDVAAMLLSSIEETPEWVTKRLNRIESRSL